MSEHFRFEDVQGQQETEEFWSDLERRAASPQESDMTLEQVAAELVDDGLLSQEVYIELFGEGEVTNG
ncbi:MAG TPA: hypothetical protein VLG27_02270 [Candidatus Saccharimonadia bacterium]|nr:hypothetical protein [Candidatus Saccharimonadia bacterium]